MKTQILKKFSDIIIPEKLFLIYHTVWTNTILDQKKNKRLDQHLVSSFFPLMYRIT